MAFGKDSQNLNRVQPFGGNQARIGQQNKIINQARGQSRGTAPYWKNQYKPNKDVGGDPDRVRLIRGDYEVDVVVKAPAPENYVLQKMNFAYFPCEEHTFMVGPNQPRGYICSGGAWHNFRDKREPCLGCENYFNNRNNKNSPHGKASMHVFTTLQLGYFAKLPQVNRETGQPVMNEKTNEPYYNWERIFRHEIKKYEQMGVEMRDWALLHWPMKWGAFSTVSAYDEEVAKCCRTCGTRFSIETEVWLCSSCGIDLIDPNSGVYNPADIKALTTNIQGVTCSHCNHVGMLTEMIRCNTCSQAVRADIFDVDLLVKAVKNEKTDKFELKMFGFEGPHPIDQRYTVPQEEGKKPIAHAIDLARIYAPSSIEEQEKVLGGSRTGRAPVTADNFSKPWSQQGGGAPVLGSGGGSGPNYR